MNKNWIKLNRRLMKTAYYKKDHEKVFFWIHLLLRANFEPTKEYLAGRPIVCKPGQFTTGRRQLAEETGMNESKIERLLTYFEKTEQQIEQQKTRSNRLITILNWQAYQYTEQANGQPPNNHRTTSEQPVNTLEEYKEDKELKERKGDFEILKKQEKEYYEKQFADFDKILESEEYDPSNLK